MSNKLDKEVRDLIKDRADAELDLDLAVALIEWLTDSMGSEERTSAIVGWAAFNDAGCEHAEGVPAKHGWKFIKDCGLLIGTEGAKTEYKIYKKGWFRG